MKTINMMNEENEKTEVFCKAIDLNIRWLPFNDGIFDSDEKVASGRGGELLKKSWQLQPGMRLEVKCSKTELTGNLYWSWAAKGIIDRIEWSDGIISKY